MSKKENLPLNTEDEKSSSITYADEVIAIIAGVAAGEVEGIAEMCSAPGNGVGGKNRNITKGVKVEVGTEEVGVDVYVVMEYGTPIQQAAKNVQESVRKAIEEMTGMNAVRVDVHVQGVSFAKENKALSEGEKNAALSDGSEKKNTEDAAEEQSEDTTETEKTETETETETEANAEAEEETPAEE